MEDLATRAHRLIFESHIWRQQNNCECPSCTEAKRIFKAFESEHHELISHTSSLQLAAANAHKELEKAQATAKELQDAVKRLESEASIIGYLNKMSSTSVDGYIKKE